MVSAALTEAPWCAVVLLAEQPLSVTEAAMLLPILPRTALILHGGLDLDPTRILAALRLRQVPAAAEVCDYLRLRRLPRALIAAVEDALAAREGEGEDEDEDEDGKIAAAPHRSTINRRLAEFGPLRARSWRALLRLLQFEAPVSLSGEQAAWDAGLDPRTLRARAEEFVGIGPLPALDTPGWEWKLEAALRRHGYVAWPSRTRRSSSAMRMPVVNAT
jgi:hypothetical protein